MNDKVLFEVEFDSEVWATMNNEQKSVWINKVTDSINDHARVSGVFVSGEQK